MSTSEKVAVRSGSVNGDWTKEVDRFLARVRGMPAPEAAARFGVGRDAIVSWRRKRERGEAVTGLRAKYQKALMGALELGDQSGTIPISGVIRFRRVVKAPRKLDP